MDAWLREASQGACFPHGPHWIDRRSFFGPRRDPRKTMEITARGMGRMGGFGGVSEPQIACADEDWPLTMFQPTAAAARPPQTA